MNPAFDEACFRMNPAEPVDHAWPVDQLAESLVGAVGSAHVLTDPEIVSSYTRDWTGRWQGTAALVVRPGTTAEVAEVVRLCRAAGASVVAQGGNTGLVGGSVPPGLAAGPGGAADPGLAAGPGGAADPGAGASAGLAAGPGAGASAVLAAGPGVAAGPAVVLSLVRLTDLGPVDTAAGQVTVGAGVALGKLQGSLAGSGLAFAVDLAARDTATIGGMVATNAGGIHVIRYGSMRAQVLGLEAVLADGSVVTRLDGLVKDNTGYDLSQLLIGSEGTLAIITRARLRLVPALPARYAALMGLPDTHSVIGLVARLRQVAPSLEAAEVFYPEGLELVMAHAGLPAPFPRSWGAYLLAECAGPDDSVLDELAAVAEDLGHEAAAVGLDGPGRQRLWAYRERLTEAVNSLGVPHKMDVTLPIGLLARFETEVREVVARAAPSSKLILWGHVGDGNLHVNVVGPDADDNTVDDAVLRLVAGFGGSISAEHGIGRAKAGWLSLTRSPAEIQAMQAIKRALDPSGFLNPGVLFALNDVAPFPGESPR